MLLILVGFMCKTRRDIKALNTSLKTKKTCNSLFNNIGGVLNAYLKVR